MKTLVLGLGNPIMGDDAVGCVCARDIRVELETLDRHDVEVEEFYRGGISLMERLIGYDRVLIIDSITDDQGEIGKIVELSLDDLPSRTAVSPHDCSLKIALELASRLGEKLPVEIDILAVEIQPVYEFSECLTLPVAESVRGVRQLAMKWIHHSR